MTNRETCWKKPRSEEAQWIRSEAEEHRLAFMRWRHNPGNSQLGIGKLLPQDLGYYADEREHCTHCVRDAVRS